MSVDKLKSGILGAIAALFGLFFGVDYWQSLPPVGATLARGRVIRRASTTVWIGATRPLLTVRIDDTGTDVIAVLSANSHEQIPDAVTFYYGGDRNVEVFLLEETNPLWIALSSVFIAAVLFTHALWPHAKPTALEMFRASGETS